VATFAFVATCDVVICGAGRNQVPAGLDGGDGGENHVPCGLDGGDEHALEIDAIGISSSLSLMSAQRSEASPATDPSELATELPTTVLSGLHNSVDLKLPKSADLKMLSLYTCMSLSLYARWRCDCTANSDSSGLISNSKKVFFITNRNAIFRSG
jgi:hypothetical protein